MKIVGISDVSIGYGSPEVPALMDSVCRLFNVRGTLIEPDEIARPPIVPDKRLAFDVQRINSVAEDYSRCWNIDYISGAVKTIDSIKPDLFIVFGPGIFNILLLLKKRPKKILYQATEFIGNDNKARVEAHQAMLADVDLMTFPEVDRLIIDTETIETQPKNVAPILNCADVDLPNAVQYNSAEDRNGHFLFYGTLDRQRAFAHYFWNPEVAHYPVDIFGRISDPDVTSIMTGLQSNANCRYFGILSASELNARRRHYSWSFVWWNPEISAGAHYLASNRFFTSIQAGVPPICGPHPQCVTFVKRYNCGIIMDDWSVHSLIAAMKYASSIAGTPAYKEMVNNCLIAAKELNWNTQFERARPAILGLAS